MGYFDSIKNNQSLTVKEKKDAFDKQLRENKQKIYPHVVLTILNAIGCSKLELARRLGVSAADITRITTESFHMSPNTLIRLCALVFNMSCHTFLFGEPSMTILPASLKLVCKTVDGWSGFWKHECLNKLKYLKELNKEFSGQYAPTTEDIFTERILEIASDKYCPPEDFLGKEVCAATKAPIRNYLNGTVTTVSIGTIMFIAMLANNSADYFLLQDYTKYGTVGYLESDKVVMVSDRLTIKIISELLQMPPYLRSNCIGHILSMDMSETH